MLHARAKPLASPATNDRPTRRSCRRCRPFLLRVLPPRSPPALLPLPYAARHILSPTPAGCRPVPATLCDSLSRSASTATPLAAQTRPAPCTPATAAAKTLAAHSSLPHPRRTPPAADCRPRPCAPSPPPRSLPDAGPTPLRSRRARSGNRGTSPADRHALHIRYSRRADTSPDRPSDTVACPLLQTGWE